MIEYKICTRCIMDTADPNIEFDDSGVCNHCRDTEIKLKGYPFNLSIDGRRSELEKIVREIRREGRNKKYDCIIGVSGGADSTYVAYMTKKLGLRPLAVHLDNGWDSELAVKNIEQVLTKMGIDLFTYVLNWEEFKDLQLAFLKASTPDSEIPTDHAIHALLYRVAAKNGVKHIILGFNTYTESILPKAWSDGHLDWKYIKAVHERFGNVPLKTFPNLGYFRIFYYQILKRIKYTYILDYLDYRKRDAIEILKKEIDWQHYGGKHHESFYTKFFQAYILPEKFGFDKRKAHLSSMICAGQISREDALEEMQTPPYSEDSIERDIEYVSAKFGISVDEFRNIMNLSPQNFSDYPSYSESWHYKLARSFYNLLRPKRSG